VSHLTVLVISRILVSRILYKELIHRSKERTRRDTPLPTRQHPLRGNTKFMLAHLCIEGFVSVQLKLGFQEEITSGREPRQSQRVYY
jgi:hypothetical protein